MRGFTVLLQKEFREAWRSWKFLWIPLVFALLGMTDPLTNYYMMDILNAVGNLPEGFEMLMPELMPADLLYASIGQFQTIGLLVFMATFVGAVSKERASGMATLLYVRPISFGAYFMSKFVVMSTIGFVSILAGFAASVYYTVILFGTFEIGPLVASFITYFSWLLFVIAVTLMMSATFKTVVATTCAFAVIFIGQILDTLVGAFWTISPWKLPLYGVQLIRGTMEMPDYWWSLSLTLVITIICVSLGILTMKKNASTTKI
ncbi:MULTISPECIES: ABC transporter permease subunit [unclassified Lysinibacillus]|uniref:ABC transporter permease n=1 Tax=unclassified Lysinibacillus TaxID=2636778 RepID=UPI0020127C74|nr:MULTISPECIES: ABC transporter permease subunit [unclassified Lysinibacillus]MCL1698557.1 ABC transporter permease [Lysinibacillus sp. BPa_S21]MCL1703059.1 ABC transporter permease [Lysinibacillus sp. Bpr_S20]